MTDGVDCYLSEASYFDHVVPIWLALPEELRGAVYAPRNLRGQLPETVRVEWSTPPSSAFPLIVAGYQDLRYARRPKVLVNHGAGMTYLGVDSPSYAGGPGRDAADLFLHPNERAAALDRARYPHARSVAVGCPKLDEWKTVSAPGDGTVAVTFHWDCFVVPETRSAWPAWRDTIAELAKHVHVVGHAHPRARRELEPWWQSIGVEYVPHARDLLDRADVLVADNTSLLFEWAACGRPTVWLRSPLWRNHIEHGLRFGEQLPGPEIEARHAADIDQLYRAISEETVDATVFHRIRPVVAARVYGPDDRCASVRAADAVLSLIAHGPGERRYTTPRPCNC